MKNLYSLFFAIAVSGTGFAQSFFDDFESYAPGDYIGVESPEWTTWSGTTGGQEDAQVITTNAHSGNNAIHFYSTSTSGGPQDVILPFGGPYNSGQFNFESWFYVEPGTAGYFNFQKTATIGEEWALDIYMEDNGSLLFANGGSQLLMGTYPQGQWFHLEINCNLTLNEWEVVLDGTTIGTFSNPDNQVASLDLYAVNSNGNSSFFVDDIGYSFTPYTAPSVNAAVILVDSRIKLAGQKVAPIVKVRNIGQTTISSFDLEVGYNGEQLQKTVSGISLASLDEYEVEFDNPFTGVAGSTNMVATVSNVNGAAQDDDPSDDSKTIAIDPVIPAPGKMVMAEEGTGTWCQWCPRGAVAMDRMANEFGNYFAGIAIHNGSNDPMVDEDYDEAMGNIISGYPSALVDRGTPIDPGNIEIPFLDRITIAPKALISNQAYVNDSTGELTVTLTYVFTQNGNKLSRVAMVLTEDNLSGTTSGWAQSNAYAGGANGPMGGYENLPHPVPASMMEYDHVARIIVPGFEGKLNSFTSDPQAGDTHTFEFTIMPDTAWDLDNMHIIGMLIDPTGKIDNASHTTVNEVLVAMPDTTDSLIGINKVVGADAGWEVYPNPSNGKFTIAYTPDNNSHVSLNVVDITGKQVYNKVFGTQAGAQRHNLDLGNLPEGIYFLELKMGPDRLARRIVIR